MAHNYYLLNGKDGKGKALNVLVDGKLHRNFIDISTLDLATLDIKEEDAVKVLKEYNPKLDLTGMFYNASYPHSKTKTKSYATIFNQENDKTKDYLDSLRYFAEQRNYKKEHKQVLRLDMDRKLEDYIRKIIYNIIKNNAFKLTEYESLMSSKLKEIITDKFYIYYDKDINKYINSRIYTLRSILNSYTELRNITLEYILYLQNENTNLRTAIKNTENWDNMGMEVIEPIIYTKGQDIIIPKQMELADYLPNFPKVRSRKK
ncbi:MAG: hypothetical protein VZS44_03370 [Bacilli bacterium]|nr:hypothetical protein [Bacilli bacterium]